MSLAVHGYQRRIASIVLIALIVPVYAQQLPQWKDPSPHTATFVTVERGVRLEVLDWGGSGPSIVLLAGSGNTAHIFDNFALKLLASGHVYGVTRRGFGASGHPESGYTDQRLADDVLQVLDSLKIVKPVLVGHSMAGSELTTLGGQHSDRLSGLVYLDAGDDPTDTCWNNQEYHALFAKLPASKPASPSDAEKKSFQAFHDYWQRRTINFALPESELRNMYDENPDGSVGSNRTPGFVRKAIADGSKTRDYARIRVPVLAFFAVPPSQVNGWSEYYRFQPTNDEERAALEKIYATDRTCNNQSEDKMRAEIPGVRIVALPGADHYVFFSNEADVLREMKSFLASLLTDNSRGFIKSSRNTSPGCAGAINSALPVVGPLQ